MFTCKSAHILWRRLSPSLDKTLGRKKWLLSSSRPPKWWYLTFECFEGCLSVPRIDSLLKKFIKSGAKIVSSKLETTKLTTLYVMAIAITEKNSHPSPNMGHMWTSDLSRSCFLLKIITFYCRDQPFWLAKFHMDSRAQRFKEND